MAQRKIIIIAGPNGAGKTTFAQSFLPLEANCSAFINADLIAKGMSPFAPDRVGITAGKLMLELIDRYIGEKESFALETTLSSRLYARRISQWQALGYRVELFFLTLPNVEFAIERVAQRVTQGGHDIPEDVIRRRFHRGKENFHTIYKFLVNTWAEIDSSVEPFDMIDWKERND